MNAVGAAADFNRPADDPEELGLALLREVSSRRGSVPCMRDLIRRGARLDLRNDFDESILMLAGANGYEPVVRDLLDRGLSPSGENRDGNSPIIMAAAAGQTDIALLYVARGARADQPNKAGNTALISAAIYDHPGTVEALLPHVRDPEAANGEGANAWHAAQGKKKDDIRRLIEADRARRRAAILRGGIPFAKKIKAVDFRPGRR